MVPGCSSAPHVVLEGLGLTLPFCTLTPEAIWSSLVALCSICKPLATRFVSRLTGSPALQTCASSADSASLPSL